MHSAPRKSLNDAALPTQPGDMPAGPRLYSAPVSLDDGHDEARDASTFQAELGRGTAPALAERLPVLLSLPDLDAPLPIALLRPTSHWYTKTHWQALLAGLVVLLAVCGATIRKRAQDKTVQRPAAPAWTASGSASGTPSSSASNSSDNVAPAWTPNATAPSGPELAPPARPTSEASSTPATSEASSTPATSEAPAWQPTNAVYRYQPPEASASATRGEIRTSALPSDVRRDGVYQPSGGARFEGNIVTPTQQARP